jgi:hypothetical protein
MSTRVLIPSSFAHRFWGANRQTSSHLILRPKSRNSHGDFDVQITKSSTLVLRPKPKNHRSGFEAKPLTNHCHQIWGQTGKLTLLVFSTCMMQITHYVNRPPDRLATEYPTCVWSSLILRTKSPIHASILIAVYYVTFATYTSRDKQTRFSTSNNSIWG